MSLRSQVPLRLLQLRTIGDRSRPSMTKFRLLAAAAGAGGPEPKRGVRREAPNTAQRNGPKGRVNASAGV
jgi:hypothetical protein